MKKTLQRHFSLLNIDPRISVQLTTQILKWYHSSGPDFVIMRLKALKLAYLSYLNDEKDFLRHLIWFRRTRTNVKGPFSLLFRINKKKKHHVRLGLSLINTYYIFTSSAKNRYEKEQEAIEAIREPYKGSRDYPDNFQPFNLRGLVTPVIKPNFAGLNTSKPTTFKLVKGSKWLESILETSMEELPYQEYLDASSIKPKIDQPDHWDSIPRQHSGDLAFLHENGGKCRVVCMPHAELQVVFKPFHESLIDILKRIPEDCTFDQESGALWAQEELRMGKTLHSIDLKTATDRFPLWLQLKMLESSGFNDSWLKAFRVTAKCYFESTHGRVAYGAGQPMGLYGSFPLLALGQHGLVRMAGYLNGIKTSNQYRVLGDDIVFSNKKLAEFYQSLLQRYDIPISTHKCINGSIGEFCGYVITAKSINKGVKCQGKFDLDNYLNYIKVVGFIPKSIPAKIRKALEPIVYSPTDNGGLGLNPLGLPLNIRSSFYDDLYTETKWRDRTLRGVQTLRSSLTRAIYESKSVFMDSDLINSLFSDVISRYLDQLDEDILRISSSKGIPLPDTESQALQLAFLEDPSFIGLITNFSVNDRKVSYGYLRDKYPYYSLYEEYGLLSEYDQSKS